MDQERPRLAIPIFRSRVAPVLNWCSKMLILGEKATSGTAGQEVLLLNMDAFDRLRILQTEGIQTLICGALSPDLLSFGSRMGFHIIAGIAGDIDEVLHAYQARELDHPRFWLPGCSGPHHYAGAERSGAGKQPAPRANPAESQGALETEQLVKTKSSRGPSPHSPRGRTGNPRAPSGCFCSCPRCGMRIRHGWGLSCSQVYCPQCDLPMIK